jgi:hypothetical protein
LLQQYLSNIVKPLLVLSQQEPLEGRLAVLALEGYNEVIGTRPHLAIPALNEVIFHYRHFQGDSVDVNKLWTSILIELVDND